MKRYDLTSFSYSRSTRSGHLGKFWFSRSPIFALDNSRPLPGSRRRCWLTTFKFISNETRYGLWRWEKRVSFKEFFCLRIHNTAERMPWTKSSLWSLASSRFFVGSMGERCAADFDSVGDRSTSFNSWQTHRCANPCD